MLRFIRWLAATFAAAWLPVAAQPPAELSLGSWNLEWLAAPAALEAAGFWSTCEARGWPNEKLRADLPFCDVYHRRGIRTPADYEREKLGPLRRSLAAHAMQGLDVLAVQEVRDADALRAVLPAGFRVACFTGRADALNVGFAVREAARLKLACREVRALSLEGDRAVSPVRRGLQLTVDAGGTTVAILNVHLKSRCARGRMDKAGNEHCRTLQRQAAPLEAWMEAQAQAGRPFMILGDWNRDLEAEQRGGYPARNDGSDPTGPIAAEHVNNLLPEINDGAPAGSRIELALIDRSAAAGKACHDVLDQLVISSSLRTLLRPQSLVDGRLPARFVRGGDAASDHCRIEAVLRFR